jgi:urease accessory protein
MTARPGPLIAQPDSLPRAQRTDGAARVSFAQKSGGTRLDRLFQSGASKIRLPLVEAGDPPLAVLINTAGGLTGGDRISTEVAVGAGCEAVVTTQACEKIYRSASGDAEIRTSLAIGENARLDWLPQETILFDGARLTRRLEAEIAPCGELLLVEAAIFGRAARGESIRSGFFSDRWRIRKDGRLLFADDLRFDWADADLLGRPAVLAGGAAMATILLVAEEPARHLPALREILGDRNGGASAWNGKLLARLVARSGIELRAMLVPMLRVLREGAELPKFWQI